MPTIELKKIIAAPIEVAWAVISDMEGCAHITAEGISKVEVLKGDGKGMLGRCDNQRGESWTEICPSVEARAPVSLWSARGNPWLSLDPIACRGVVDRGSHLAGHAYQRAFRLRPRRHSSEGNLKSWSKLVCTLG